MTTRVHALRPLLLLSAYLGRSLTQILLLWACASQGGARGAGEFATVFAIVAPVFAVFELALRNVYQTKVDPPPFRSFFLIRIFFATVATAVVIILSIPMGGFGALPLLAPVLVMKVADSAIDICIADLQVKSNYLGASGWMWINTAGTVAALCAGVAAGAEPAYLIWASGLVSWLVFVALASTLLAPSSPWLPTRTQIRSVLVAGTALGAAQGLSSFAFYLPTLFLSIAATSSQVGVFAVGQYAVTAASLALSALMQTWLSPLRQATDYGRRAAGQIVRTASIMVAIGCAGAVLTVGLLPTATVTFLGEEFLLSWWEAVTFGVAVAALGLDYAATTALLVINRYGRRTIGVLAGVICGTVLAVVLAGDATVLSAAWVLASTLTASAAVSAWSARRVTVDDRSRTV